MYINVYRPEFGPEDDREHDEPLPVMFWVYGGGFIMGDATEENYLPGPLLDTGDVIVVTGNYRVGPLGFMCMEDDNLPGELLKDLIFFIFFYSSAITHKHSSLKYCLMSKNVLGRCNIDNEKGTQ